LLIGYLYARVITSKLSGQNQAWLHSAILAISLALLPVGPSARWIPGGPQTPVWLILSMLTATVALPFAALSATSPLLQHWLGRGGSKRPYALFAVSNFASLAALIAYPLVIEPTFDMTAQRNWWSGLYLVFSVLCALTAWRAARSGANNRALNTPGDAATSVSSASRIMWFVLAACGSMLLLSVANHITQNVAAVPLLWVLPLATYLLTFVLAFGRRAFYNRAIVLRLLAVALGVVGYAIYDIAAIEAIQVSIPIFLFGLFVCCLFCHGELNRLRPEVNALTDFYVMIAAGSAAGALFVGLIAPRLFQGIYELPLTLVFTVILALVLTWRSEAWPLRLLWLGAAAGMIAVLGANVSAFRENSLSVRRSFYGALRVVQSEHAGERQTRTLFHGTIEHGSQFLAPAGRGRPTTYYGPDSGIGIVLRECFASPKQVGVVGLGVGTIAAYGASGDTFRFYEINQQVIDIAQSLFFYLRESHARVETTLGDARLSLEHEAEFRFDVLALDAFSGDAVPAHLLTREAIAVYTRHIKPSGVMAFHVSNDYLDLGSVVAQLARNAGYQAALVRNHSDDDRLILAADWLLVTNNRDVLENAAVKLHSQAIAVHADRRLWTDNYNNLLQILKVPKLR
jgi:hypothetical protein